MTTTDHPDFPALYRALAEAPTRHERLAAIHTLTARCYVALAEIDYDLRAWAEDTYVRNVIDDCGRLSDFEEHTAAGFGLLGRALGRAS